MFGGYFSYVKGLEILSFRRFFFLYLGVWDSYVWGLAILTFGG